LEAQKHGDPVDPDSDSHPDPEHCLLVKKMLYFLLDMGDSVLENILEVNSGMEAGRTYMYLVHSEKVQWAVIIL
jgi:hypothetical protein